jgi:acetyltransferase-like isoleucine patch superfamily enzyme
MVLFGKPNMVKFGKGVKLSGQLKFGKNINLGDYSNIRGKNVIIENNVFVHENVLIRSNERIKIGSGTTINRNCCVLAKVDIGNNCSIAPNVVIVGSTHLYDNPLINIKEQGCELLRIVIEEDVWIGANSTILGGITIGKGSVVAAGSVVNKDVENFTVVGGVPAKILKYRK